MCTHIYISCAHTHTLSLSHTHTHRFFIDTGSVHYAYETAPGYLALGAQFVTMIYFGHTMLATITSEGCFPRKNFFARYAYRKSFFPKKEFLSKAKV